MQHYQLPQEKVKHFVVVIGTIFLLTINMCDRGRTITHLQIPRFHTQVWYIKTYDNVLYHSLHSSYISLTLLCWLLLYLCRTPLHPPCNYDAIRCQHLVKRQVIILSISKWTFSRSLIIGFAWQNEKNSLTLRQPYIYKKHSKHPIMISLW